MDDSEIQCDYGHRGVEVVASCKSPKSIIELYCCRACEQVKEENGVIYFKIYMEYSEIN